VLVSVCLSGGELRISGLMPSKIIRKRQRERGMERDIQCGEGYKRICKREQKPNYAQRKERPNRRSKTWGIARAGKRGATDYLVAGNDISPYMS
jgi:hypothetical protein